MTKTETEIHSHSHLEMGQPEGKSEIELGLLQMQILWVLSRKSTHGYDLMKALGAIKGTIVTQGTMYPALQRLEEMGLVKPETDDRKIVYHITDKGRKTMNQTCLDFVKTFYGIFHDYACGGCSLHRAHK